jgi:hypothetical protein
MHPILITNDGVQMFPGQWTLQVMWTRQLFNTLLVVLLFLFVGTLAFTFMWLQVAC